MAEPAAGTDSDLYKAVSRRSLKRSAAMRALDSSCSGMLLMSEEKGLSGFSKLISQLVFPREVGSTPKAEGPKHPTSYPSWSSLGSPIYHPQGHVPVAFRAPHAQEGSDSKGLKDQAQHKVCP